jgi:leucyl aminopeptidase
VRSIKKESFAFVVPTCDNISSRDMGAALIEGVVLGLHVFNDFKTSPEIKAQTQVGSVTLLTDNAHAEELREGAQSGHLARKRISARGIWSTCRPTRNRRNFWPSRRSRSQQENGLRCEVWDENRIVEERMEALYGVGMGSDNPPRFIVLEYAPKGKENEAPLILVGKGMSFDSGGYSIKPAAGMEDMKTTSAARRRFWARCRSCRNCSCRFAYSQLSPAPKT